MQEIPASDFLQPWICRPPVHRDLVYVLDDIDEAYVLGVCGEIPYFVEGFAEAVGCFMEDVGPLREDVIGRQCAVVRLELDAHLDFVQVAAGLQIVEDLLVEGRPVGDGAVE